MSVGRPKGTKSKARVINTNCYVEIIQYTPIRGVLTVFFVTILLMIPALNLRILEQEHKESRMEQYKNKEFWEGCFYNKVKVEVIRGENKK